VRERLGRALAGLPGPIRKALVGLASLGVVVLILYVVVWPLINNTGAAAAEVDGAIPTQATVGHPLSMILEITSDGDQTINPVCARASFSAPVTVESVNFDNIETIPAKAGQACGGMLATQEQVAIVIRVVPEAAGAVTASVVATQGDRVIGPALTGTIMVSP
jgi:hypothetical protein